MAVFSFFRKSVRTRFAPSPTGPLHIGGAHTALFNYLFARQNGGKFILRIEDTDKRRSDRIFEKDIIDSLSWLGFDYDEFYRQSERILIYRGYLKNLIDKKSAFWCYHSKEELAEEKRIQMERKEAPRHVCTYKSQNAIRQLADKSQKNGVIRLAGSDEKIKFTDLVRGDIEYQGSLLGDIVIAKDFDNPLYNFAAVVDDYEMGISHVIRAEDHIPNTPKQILIHRAMGIKTPFYAHIPLILGVDRSKLSKRHGAASVDEYKKLGYLPDAMFNFMSFLGWNPGGEKEIMDREEIIKNFSLEKTQKGGAIFNLDKLNWFNSEYIKKMPDAKLTEYLMSFVRESWRDKITQDTKYWEKIIQLEKTRLARLSEINEYAEYFFVKPNFPKALLVWKNENTSQTAAHLDKLLELLSGLSEGGFKNEQIKNAVWQYAEERGRGNVLWPFRVALTGRAKSPDPFNIAEILGKNETLARLEYARAVLRGGAVYAQNEK